ncbi:DarT ssDNA thymidine ADP-ribosyltransferase family protein [Pseudomonas auratipiscis]|uniref:DarT ssDNA thymidine ADP-ribosyltransferase family protein n=1 Tax=Pseudomonas auratipiscis TaxID=3115853 RepID=A0AB35WZ79_9PSED|nr:MULTISPECIES: DarT ssDNA thymidine ADP-ribosyltransferase family protein [unclassified Pseudomonas]MEE1869238.1 DarT ssDNA thymidine ADP-ribosyltransferase family protein [Pseudomonas sp. 120P]MEE1960039.1 DarT ssDNA thymidine ADP-ribosyltransferase family protein [Pseudomonas sp. 119P]
MSVGPLLPSPKIYHIAQLDRLPFTVADGVLWWDAKIVRRSPAGSNIGVSGIHQRRSTTEHWVMSREGATQHDSVARQVYGWNLRKQQFTPR